MTLLTVVVLAGMALGAQQQTDTTFAVAAGGRLTVEALNGSVTVRSWDRDAMRIRATHPPGTRLEIEQRAGRVSVEANSRRAPESAIAFEIVVPRSFSIAVEGVRMRTTIEGVNGRIDVSNAEGQVVLRDVRGDVNVESVGGAVTLTGVRGNVDASTVNETIRLSDVRGDISVSTVNGGIVMRGIDAHRVEASTVNGMVEYIGAVHDRGRYYLGAHNGQITMGLPETANAAVVVSTRMGQVDAAFPVPAGSIRDGRLTFTLGSGSARVELDSFNGAVRLVRPRAAQ